MHASTHNPGHHPSIEELSQNLDATLKGALPCISCRYDLQGISIRDVCPECGTAVRATILNKVDPEADEFRPLLAPRLTATGLMVWAVAGFGAAACIWAIRIAELLNNISTWHIRTEWATPVMLALVALSGLALVGLVRPVRGMPLRRSLAAMVAMLGYLPLLWLLTRIHEEIDPLGPAPYFSNAALSERSLLRIAMAVCLIGILLLIRPNAGDLVRRCMAMRTGRVGRQTLLAMVAVLAVMIFGDLLRIWAGALPSTAASTRDVLLYIGKTIILLGSLLLTLGLYHVVLDARRIGGVLLRPPPSMRDILGPDTPADSPTGPS
ncbi:MAG: hypothetical protein KDA21_09910 [Phycisphaerales bacterium]|nr:hypothetical protein [Phycisphaerales bacterium]